LPPVVQLPGKSDLRHHVGWKVPLIPWIVDREHSGHRRAESILQDRPEIDQRQRSMPVMGVQEDRSRYQPRQRSYGCQRKEREATGVVEVVYGVFAIDPVPVEVIQVLDEEDLGPG